MAHGVVRSSTAFGGNGGRRGNEQCLDAMRRGTTGSLVNMTHKAKRKMAWNAGDGERAVGLIARSIR